MSDQKISVKESKALVEKALMRSKTSKPNATSVANALVNAEIWGQTGHGLRRVLSYAEQSKVGKVDGWAVPEILHLKPALVHINAADGFAYPAIDLMMKHLPEIAREQGIALAGIYRSHHCGALGLVVEQFARRGLIAMMFANTPAAMAPWGGNWALFGTNPIAFSVPTKNRNPLVIDLSLSKVARGKIIAASQKGLPIPEGWALDKNGEPTIDANEALDGFMLPAANEKGIALAIMVELLSAGLTGANYSYEASSFFNSEGPRPGVGQTIIAIDPNAFGEHIIERMEQLIKAIAETEGARVPSETRYKKMNAIIKNGISVDRDLLHKIRAI